MTAVIRKYLNRIDSCRVDYKIMIITFGHTFSRIANVRNFLCIGFEISVIKKRRKYKFERW